MGYYAQQSFVVLSPDPHAVHDTRKAIVLSDVNHPDIGPNQDPQRYAVMGCTSSDAYSYAPIRLPTRGLEQGMFRKPVYAMPWSLHTVDDPASELGTGILKSEGKLTGAAFSRVRDGLYAYLGGDPP